MLTASFTALTVVLSFINFPVAGTRLLPWQHMTNVLAGVLLGPWYALFIAILVAIFRVSLGTGTFFAFPGGIPGALTVGLVYRYLKRNDMAVFTEPIGTFIGALVSSLLVTLGVLSARLTPVTFIILFLASSIPGTILGFSILKAVRKSGLLANERRPQSRKEGRSPHSPGPRNSPLTGSNPRGFELEERKTGFNLNGGGPAGLGPPGGEFIS